MSGGLKPKIAPSLLSSDFARLAQEAKRMVDCGADYLHIDVMDGHFVPNLTLGAPVVECLRRHTSAFFDCHMMVSQPEKWVKDFSNAGADLYCFHYEATSEPEKVINLIHGSGMKAGVAIKPSTPAEVLLDLKTKVDHLLVMTVEPGFGNQKFMSECLPKVKFLRENFQLTDIEVDGGINTGNIHSATMAGANVIVAGTSIFRSIDPSKTISLFRDSVTTNCICSHIPNRHVCK